MIADMLNNEKRTTYPIELLIRDRKLNTSLIFTIQSFCCAKKH